MIRIIIFLNILFLARLGLSQELVAPADHFPEQHLIGEAFFFAQKFSGQIFFNEEYWRGDIFMTTGDVIHQKLIKYCGATDEIIYFNEESNSAISLDKKLILAFSMRQGLAMEEVIFKKISVEKGLLQKTEPVFVQVLIENKISLFVIRNYINDGSVTAYKNNISYYNELYRPKPEYLLMIGDERFSINEKIRKLRLLRLFPEKKKIIRQVLKKNKLRSIRNESGLILFTRILNENSQEIFNQ